MIGFNAFKNIQRESQIAPAPFYDFLDDFVADVGNRIFEYFRNLVISRLFYFHSIGYFRPQIEINRSVAFERICNKAYAKI